MEFGEVNKGKLVVNSIEHGEIVDPAYRALARQDFDDFVQPLRGVDSTPPSEGWIRTIRTALGMSTSDLAMRLGVSQQRVSQYEAAEQSGSIKLDTLERICEAFGAKLQYAIVPEQSLGDMVAARARALAVRELAATEHSMALEDQRPTRSSAPLIDKRALELESSPLLWRDPV